MNRYKYTPKFKLSTRLTKKLSVNTNRFLNLLNSGLTSPLVASRTGVSTRTVQRLRARMVRDITKNTNYSNWNFASPVPGAHSLT